MANNREISQFAGLVTVNDTTNQVSIASTLELSGGGRLGIGTDNPGAIAHIDGTTNNTPLVLQASQTNRSRLVFRNNQETGTECTVELIDEDLRFNTNSGERMRIVKDGKIGIGITDPDGFLTIKGNSDESTTPSIRLLDGTDTREVSISNYSGDFVASTHGTDNNVHGRIQIFENGQISLANGGASGSVINRFSVLTSGDYTIQNALKYKVWTTVGANNGVTETKNLIALNATNNSRVYGEISVWCARSGVVQQRAYIRYAITLGYYNGSYYGLITEVDRQNVAGFSTFLIELSGDNIRLRHVGNTAAASGSILIEFRGGLANGATLYS